MISRLTLSALVFAVIGTASLAFAATAHQAAIASSAAAKQVPVVQLERVVIVAKRLPAASI